MIKKAKVIKIKVRDLFIVLAIIAVITLGILTTKGNIPEKIVSRIKAPSALVPSQVKLDMYVMSQCPYGAQAEDAAIAAVKKFGNAVDFNVYFIAREAATGFSSLHGQAEVDEDIRQCCVMKNYPDKYQDYLLCINKDYKSAGVIWESCASKNNIDKEKIKNCFEGEEGKNLLRESIKATNEVKAQGSPTIYLNDKQYTGARDILSFTRAICAQLPKNSVCEEIPACAADSDCTADPTKIGKCVNPNTKEAKCEYTADVEVQFIVLNDKNCGEECDVSQIVSVTKRLFPNIKEKDVDYNSAEGKQLFKELNLKLLPAYIFDSSVEKAARFPQVQGALIAVGDNYVISPAATGSNYNPMLEEKPNRLQLFVMSFCPYGIQAEGNLKEVLDLFGDQLNFSLHFIASENENGSFISLHGQTEVDEDLRQVCAIKYYPSNYYDYILCRNKDTKADWQTCAEENKIDTQKIKTCSEGEEGKKLLVENIKATDDFGITGSPTFIINNKYTLSGAQPAETIKQQICNYNNLVGCDKKLTTATNQQVPTTGGCS